VKMHIARAPRAIQRGFQLLEKFNQSLDPELTTTLPGNQNARHQTTEREFRRMQKILEKILPKERQNELGIDRVV